MNGDDAGQPLARGYRVMVDDNFHFMDEQERHCQAEFATYAEALECAKGIVEGSMAARKETEAEELLKAYQSFGDDPFIVPFGGAEALVEKFSAWDYARVCAERLAAERLAAERGGK